MESMYACGAGVDVEDIEARVVHDLEDVGVPADEEGGRGCSECTANGCVVVAGVASDVLDEHVGSLNGEAVYLGVAQAYVSPIDVAPYGTERAESLEPLGYLERTDVARVPHLIALGKVPCVAFVPMAVGVGEEADALHNEGRVKSEELRVDMMN